MNEIKDPVKMIFAVSIAIISLCLVALTIFMIRYGCDALSSI